jgi:hypothetical protein
MNDKLKTCFLSELHFLKVALVWIRYLQVPILAAVIGTGLALTVVLEAGPYTLTVGAYDGDRAQVATVALVAILFSFALWDIAKVIWVNAPDRFNLRDATGSDAAVRFHPGRQHRIAKAGLKLLFASVPIMTYQACTVASNLLWYDWLVWLVMYRVLWWFHHRGIPWVEQKLSAGLSFPTKISRWISKNPGYGDPSGNGLAAGHLKQGIMLMACTAVSLVIWKLGNVESIPAAVYVLLIVLGMAWVCAALGFWFWRYHVPLFLVLGLWVSVGGGWFHADYQYRVEQKKSNHNELPTAQEILENAPNRRIAVAAVGGGIHSGAWEVEVLTRLQEIDGCGGFPEKLCALSGTSGGAYGALHYAHAVYHGSGDLSGLAHLRTAAQASSLGAVVSALAYHDLPSYFGPLRWLGHDRGNAMEERWTTNAVESGVATGENLEKVTLENWGDQARQGSMPAVLFTSGTEESGRPMIYGSSKVLDWNWNAEQVTNPYPHGPNELGDYTVPAVTGARLSASFPYVSPAARPSSKAGHLRRVEHQLDGGYYDNYGLVALNRWLEDGLTGMNGDAGKEEMDKSVNIQPENNHFLVIQIRYKNQPPSEKVKAGGFFYQASAPLTGLYHARVAGQRLRADEQFDLFCHYWQRRGITIDNAAFEFDSPEEPPLSWHLTENQKKEITKQGEKMVSEFKCYERQRKQNDNLPAGTSKEKDTKYQANKELDKIYPFGSSTYLVKQFMGKINTNHQSEP